MIPRPMNRPSRLLPALYLCVALLHLLPIWRVEYIPTQDGPSHLYNAAVLQELGRGTAGFGRVFEADLRPHPNWVTHALLWGALFVVPPLVAEKLVFSAIVLLFLGGCWRLAGVVDERCRVYAFLVMPLAFHLLLQMGFYNYSLGCALVPFAVASWWRGGRWSAAGWLVLCYFAHVVPAAMALLCCGVLWVVSLREGGRKEWTRALALLPATLLLAWFFLQPARPGGTWIWEGAFLWEPLARVMLLFTFDARQLTFGTVLGVVFALLIVVTFVLEKTRERRSLFLLLTAIAIALYQAAPLSAEEGLVLKARLLLFPYVLVLPWLTPRLARAPLAIVLALVAAGNVFFIRDHWKRNDQVIARAVAPLASAEPLRTIVPLVFERTTGHSHLELLSHAVSYAAVERRLVNLGNYEAGLGFFPVAFRRDFRRPPIVELETAPGNFEPSAWAEGVDYVYTWKMPAGAPLEARLHEGYALVADHGEAKLYRRRQ